MSTSLAYQQQPRPPAPIPPRNPLASTPQALHSTYASRMRTGATLLMQPIIASTSTTTAAVTTNASARGSRRGAAVSYTEPGSAEEDVELDSDDSDFVASGGVRTAVRAGLKAAGRLGSGAKHGSPAPGAKGRAGGEPEVQSYLGMIPPARLIVAKRVDNPTKHEYL
jgi:chromatin structure-remodeling complex subunit SFH1